MSTRILTSIGGAVLLALLGACTKKAGPASPPPPLVHVAEPIERTVVDFDEYVGRLESVETVEVRPRVSGYLDAIHFREGSEVTKGDRLFTIDPRPYQAEFDRAAAEHQRVLSQAELARNEFDRAQRLIETKVISEEDFDAKAKTYAAMQAAANAAKAAVDSARLNLEFTDIRAPISGRISRALVTEGNLVSGGLAGSTILTTIVSLDPLYLYVDVDERSILKYIRLNREGAQPSPRFGNVPVEMALVGDTGYPHQGYADFVDNRVDPGTGTMRVRGVFANTDRTLSPGFFARLRARGSGEYRALLIPDRALAADQAQKFVYVVNAQNLVEFRPVTTGALFDGLRVIRTGLQPTDRVIVEGQIRVRPGIPVQVKPAVVAVAQGAGR